MKPKILFIAFYDYGAFGIRSIQAYLKSKGYDTHTIFFKEERSNIVLEPTNKEKRLFFERISKINPDVICVSLRSPHAKAASNINGMIRKKYPDTIVIWGGTHATICPEDCIKNSDYVCVGEGEFPMMEFLDAIENNKDVTKIKNLWVRKDGVIYKNDTRELMQDLDLLAIPDFTNKCYIENNRLVDEDPIIRLSKYQVMASRGCPFRCTYCSNSFLHDLFKGKGAYVRRRSAKHVIKELLHVKKIFKNLKIISFLDEVFAFDREWIKEFVKDYKKINLPFRVEYYPTKVDEENINLLKKAGLIQVSMGIQCGSKRVRYEIFKRYTTDEQILKAAGIFNKHKITANYDIITDNPYETPQDMKDSLDMLLKLPRPYNLIIYSMNNFPKTELTQRMIADGTISKYGSGVQGFGKWGVSLRAKRSKESLVYICLMSLLSKRFIPKAVIKYLSRSVFFKKHTKPLVILTEISNNLKVMLVGMELILKGRISFAMFKQYVQDFFETSY